MTAYIPPPAYTSPQQTPGQPQVVLVQGGNLPIGYGNPNKSIQQVQAVQQIPVQQQPGPQYNATFQQLITARELHPAVAADLYNVLSTTDVVLLCDDSGSMQARISPDNIGPFANKSSTRWLELQRVVAQVVEVVTAVQGHGCRVEFLDRPGVTNVTQLSDLANAFLNGPNGRTPLYGSLSRIFKTIMPSAPGRNLLVIVIGDGEPSDCSHRDLFNLLQNKPQYCHVSFVECTDVEEDMNWLDQFDGQIQNYDNNDDFRAELARVRATMGLDFKFGMTEYVCKIILASFLRWWFALDQQRQTQAVPMWYAPRGQSNMNGVGGAPQQQYGGGYNQGNYAQAQPGYNNYNQYNGQQNNDCCNIQ